MMWDFGGSADRLLQLRRIVHRETVRLMVLTAIAVAAFLLTRMLAQRAEQLALQDAADWYARGQAYLTQSHPERAAVAFRRATMKDRSDKRYALALADALARGGNREPARRALLELRELNPENVDVNLALARLARAQADGSEAVRYYHHAIYAPAATPEGARAIRFELVRMLLDTNDPARAVAELITASIDLAEAPEVRLEIAGLFEEAGSHARAQEQYRRVLAADARRVSALEGAVRTTFALGEYRDVTKYPLPDAASPESHLLMTVAGEVISRDPLASRLSATERRRRLLQTISYLEQRWVACAPAPLRSPDYPESLRDLRSTARPAAVGRDLEALEAALGIVDRLRQQLEQRCLNGTPVDQALQIIARLHGVGAA